MDFSVDSAILVSRHYIDNNTVVNDVFLSRYDSLGNYVYSYGFGGDSASGGNNATAINVDKTGNLYYAGYGQTKIDFDPGPDSVFLQPSTLYTNIFLAKYSQVTETAVSEIRYANAAGNSVITDNRSKLILYPNPSGNYFVVNGINSTIQTYISITDGLGKTIAVYNTNKAKQYRCDVSKLIAGVYYIQVKTAGKTEVLKFVKE